MVNTPDGFHEMDNPLFNYTFQTDAAGNGFPSGDPVSLHPSMKTENLAKPRRLVDLQAPDGKFSMDRSALECWPIPKQQYRCKPRFVGQCTHVRLPLSDRIVQDWLN
jgi:hypothetical protein